MSNELNTLTQAETPNYVLTQDELQQSTNTAIKEIAEDDFYLVASVPIQDIKDTLAKDAFRGSLQVHIQGEAISLSPADNQMLLTQKTELLKKHFIANYGNSAEDKHEEKAAEDKFDAIITSYHQGCRHIVKSAFDRGLSQTEIRQNKDKSTICEPQSEQTIVDVSDDTLVTTSNNFDINLKTAETEDTLATIQSNTTVALKLKAISKAQYRAILERQKMRMEQQVTEYKEHTLDRALNEDGSPAYTESAKNYYMQTRRKQIQESIQKKIDDEANYPQFLYQLQNIETDSQFVRDTLTQNKLPQFVSQNYQSEVILQPKTHAAKIAVLDNLCQNTKAYFHEKIQKTLRKELSRADYVKHCCVPHFDLTTQKKTAVFDIERVTKNPQLCIQKAAANNEELSGNIKTYKTIDSLQQTLHTTKRDDRKLHQFEHTFNQKAAVFDETHDNGLKFFSKVIATVLLTALVITIPLTFLLWKTKSKEFKAETETALRTNLKV
jgi:hypothetical protein